jgi:hypothetical protein
MSGKISITNDSKLEVYKAQVQNVRALDTASKQLNMAINDVLRTGDDLSLQTHTKALVLLFCAWSEASFSKLVHTPYGFTDDEIVQIMSEYSKSLENAWEKCIDLGLRKVSSNPKRSNYLSNIRQQLSRIVEDYVVAPRIMRNKIAHGQWEIALNRENTAVNNEMTSSIQALDVIIVTKWFTVFRYLSDLVEVLIESPDRTFHRDYWVIVAELEDYLESTKDWTIATKKEQLRRKPKPQPLTQ